MKESLEQGFDLSSAVLASELLDRGSFLVFAPRGFERSPMKFSAGGVTRLKFSEKALSKFLKKASEEGARSVVVEDDMRRAGDPSIAKKKEPLAFVRERILHWCDLKQGGDVCVQTILRGAFGYPRNAFVTTCSSSELGLVDQQQAAAELPRLIVQHLVAVIVNAFDSESFLIWVKTDQK